MAGEKNKYFLKPRIKSPTKSSLTFVTHCIETQTINAEIEDFEYKVKKGAKILCLIESLHADVFTVGFPLQLEEGKTAFRVPLGSFIDYTKMEKKKKT